MHSQKYVSHNDDDQFASCETVTAAAIRLRWLDADGRRLISSYGGMCGASWPDGYVKGRQGERGQTPIERSIENLT